MALGLSSWEGQVVEVRDLVFGSYASEDWYKDYISVTPLSTHCNKWIQWIVTMCCTYKYFCVGFRNLIYYKEKHDKTVLTLLYSVFFFFIIHSYSLLYISHYKCITSVLKSSRLCMQSSPLSSKYSFLNGEKHWNITTIAFQRPRSFLLWKVNKDKRWAVTSLLEQWPQHIWWTATLRLFMNKK